MKPFQYLVGRNLRLFRKNTKNVFLCFFAIFIVLGLYVIFLRDFMIQSVASCNLSETLVHEFTDRLMISGLFVVINTTTCFGIMQQSIHDLESGIKRDYLVAPITKAQILVGYWITSIIVSFLYTCIAVLCCNVFMYVQYGFCLTFHEYIMLFLLLLLSSVVNSELLLCLIVFIKDTTTFSTFGNLYGMLAGFLAGTYLPYNLYPLKLKRILFYYPPTHLTSLFRQIYLKTIESVIPQKVFQTYGVTLIHQENVVTKQNQLCMIGIALAVMLAFLGVVHRERS